MRLPFLLDLTSWTLSTLTLLTQAFGYRYAVVPTFVQVQIQQQRRAGSRTGTMTNERWDRLRPGWLRSSGAAPGGTAEEAAVVSPQVASSVVVVNGDGDDELDIPVSIKHRKNISARLLIFPTNRMRRLASTLFTSRRMRHMLNSSRPPITHCVLY
jgi:hypothetical protein